MLKGKPAEFAFLRLGDFLWLSHTLGVLTCTVCQGKFSHESFTILDFKLHMPTAGAIHVIEPVRTAVLDFVILLILQAKQQG